MKTPLPMKIGADPEFTFNIGDSALSASQVIHSLFKDPSGDKMGKEILDAGVIGWDGCSSTAEIRPSPSTRPEEVVRNIRGLLGAAAKKNSLLSFKTLNLRAPIGGHIHFDTIKLPEKFHKDSASIRLLHYHMTLYALPLFLGENFKHAKARRGSYGHFTDYRVETKGGAKTYEFRVPSAEWITTPEIAEATLSYLGVVFAEIAEDPAKFFKANKDIAFTNEEQARAIEGLFSANYQELIRRHITTIRSRIKTFKYYPDYAKEITYLMSPKRILRDKEKCNYDASIGWGLRKETTHPGKRFFLSPLKKEEANFLKKMGSEHIISNNIRDNGDTSTNFFGSTLATAITKSGAKLEHNYFIYGLRQGIPKPIVYTGKGKFLFGHEMIKTIRDAYEVSSVISRMSENSKVPSYETTTKQTDPKQLILIGVPYDERKTMNTKPFLELVWKTERNLLAEAEIDPTKLIDDTAKDAKLGDLAELFQKEAKKE